MKKKLLAYFNDVHDVYHLKVLDNLRQSYRGVTLDYILKYVLEDKNSERAVINYLIKLHEKNKIHSLYCGHVGQIVFTNIHCPYWNYSKETNYDEGHYMEKNGYNYFIRVLKGRRDGK